MSERMELIIKNENMDTTKHIAKPSDKEDDPHRLVLKQPEEGKSEKQIAELAYDPTVQAAATSRMFGTSKEFWEADINALVHQLSEQVESAKGNDLSDLEAMLASQAYTLNAIFNKMAFKSAINMGEGYLGATDTYMKLALRAQSQCRATIETLSEVKNPPLVGYARQANFSHGHQQVNNHARENQNVKNELLEEKDGEWLDTGTKEEAGRGDSEMEAVGKVDRPAD